MLLKELSEAVGVSGSEDAVRKIILPAIQDHVTDIKINALGGITALKKGTGASPLRVMIAAHMDEIGFMVRGFDGDGLIRFSPIGGIDERILPGLRVKIGSVSGVIIWTPIHLNRDQNVVKLNNLRIDIGASSKDEAAGKVKPGDRVSFDTVYVEVGEKMLRGKAFDDRVGCSLLIDVLQGGPYPVDILAAFTVEEEIGLRGAKVAAQALNPDIAIILEGTTANDLPNPLAEPDDQGDVNPTCKMQAGPSLTVMDRSMIADPRLLSIVRQSAEAESIPYQLKTMLGGGTDGGSIHIANAGIPSTVIAMPCRYIHSPTAYLHRDDYDNGLRLIKAVLNRVGDQWGK